MISKQEKLMKIAKHFFSSLEVEEAQFLILMIYSTINDDLYCDNLRYIVLWLYDFNTGKIKKPKDVSYEYISLKLNMDLKTLLSKRNILSRICMITYYVLNNDNHN